MVRNIFSHGTSKRVSLFSGNLYSLKIAAVEFINSILPTRLALPQLGIPIPSLSRDEEGRQCIE